MLRVSSWEVQSPALGFKNKTWANPPVPLPTFDSVCKLPGRTVRHIPVKDRLAFALALCSVIYEPNGPKVPVQWLGSLQGALEKNKPNCPPDIRPIAVGEAIRHLATKCLCVITKEKAHDFLAPLLLEVSRQAVLDACGLHFPELLPWSSWCYVLQQVVSTIAEDADCASLLFHKWYIDDGVVAGPIAAIARVLAIIQDHGPPLGLYINITKCELFSLSDLSTFPDEMKRSNVPHFEILGAPIGDLVFCARFVAQKQSEASKLLQQLEAVGSINPRNTPTPLVKEAFALFADRVQQCFSEYTAVDGSASTRQQPQLSLKRGGLGLWRLSCHSPAAYIASFQSSGLSPSSGNYLSSSVDLYNSLVDPQDSLTLESVGNSHLSQKVLTSKIEDRQFGNLFHSATLTDSLHLEPAEFQVALKWWLGIPVVQGQSCPHCPSFMLDDFGHHSLSRPCLEMGCGAGYTNSQSRPADVLVPNWDLGKPAGHFTGEDQP
eukprot:Em0003g244a